MPLWAVTAEIEAVIDAPTREKAEEIANDLSYEIVRDDCNLCFHATPTALHRDSEGRIHPYLPAGWEDLSLPYGGDRNEDKTIGEILDEEAEERAKPINKDQLPLGLERK